MREYYINKSKLEKILKDFLTKTGLPVAELIRRHTPKKPLPEQRYYGIGRCPLCDMVFTFTDEGTKYCGNCGQAIDWREGGKE